MLTHKPFAILVLLYFSFIAYGQDGELQQYQNGFYIKQFSEIDGLVYNGCNYIFQDSRGFLWICTFNGLSRFDGKEFDNFRIKEGLPGSEITQVSEDSEGFIYVATTAGIARYTGYNKSSDTWFYIYPQTTHLDGNIQGMQAVDTNTIIFQISNGAVYLLRNNDIAQLTPPAGSPGFIYRNGNRYFYASIHDTLRIFNSRFENVKNIFFKSNGFRIQAVDQYGGLHLYSGNKKWKIWDEKVVYETQAHKVVSKKGGVFERLHLPPEFTVNSLHQQGVDKLGTGLYVEAISDDGIIEAVSIPTKKFVVGTQWHPEGDYYLNKTSEKILSAFGDVVRG